MKTIKVYLVATFLSPEFLVILIGLGLYFLPSQVESISSMLQDSPEILRYISLLPVAMATWVFKENKKLLFPEEDKDSIIQKWPDYWKLKVYFYVSIGYAFLFAFMGVSVWLLGYKINQPAGFLPLAVSIVGGFVVIVTTYFAKIRQKEILLGNKL